MDRTGLAALQKIPAITDVSVSLNLAYHNLIKLEQSSIIPYCNTYLTVIPFWFSIVHTMIKLFSFFQKSALCFCLPVPTYYQGLFNHR